MSANQIDLGRFPDELPDVTRGSGLLFVDGLIGGTWGRKIKSGCVEVDVRVDGPLPRVLLRAIKSEAARYAAFMGSELVVNIT